MKCSVYIVPDRKVGISKKIYHTFHTSIAFITPTNFVSENLLFLDKKRPVRQNSGVTFLRKRAITVLVLSKRQACLYLAFAFPGFGFALLIQNRAFEYFLPQSLMQYNV